MGRILIPTSVGFVVLLGGWWYMTQQADAPATTPETAQETQQTTQNTQKIVPTQSASGGEDNLVEFTCTDNKKITAVFRPESVGLTLSDGRQMELRQEVSGSGIRYVSNDGRVEFRGQGDEGFLEEGGTITYSNCHSNRL